MNEKRRRVKLGDVAMDLQSAADVAHHAIATTATMPREARSDAASELAQAVVLLNRAAARLNSFCGLDNPVKE